MLWSLKKIKIKQKSYTFVKNYHNERIYNKRVFFNEIYKKNVCKSYFIDENTLSCNKLRLYRMKTFLNKTITCIIMKRERKNSEEKRKKKC